MSDKPITPPTAEDEALLGEVMEDSITIVPLRQKKKKISWMRRGTIRKFTDIMLKGGNDDKVSCQAAAAVVLNGYWSIKFRWWYLWRWYYYVKQYTDSELGPLLVTAKKKIPFRDYLAVTILLTAMKDTMMQMTKAEADNILREQAMVKPGK